MRTTEENNNIEEDQLEIRAKIRSFDIPENDPFANDKLDRKKNAEVLTSAVSVYLDGAVMALDGAWGTGKTTFVKMWEQHLKNKGFPVIYYNAWEDDINDEPLLSLLRNLNEIAKKHDDEKLEKVLKIGGRILACLAVGVGKAAFGKLGDIISKAGEGTLDALQDQFTESLKEKDEIAQMMQNFKKVLEEYVAFVCDNGKPLVYFIDELDRCNPTFAVKVLERIKHLFDVPNVIFVLSIDKQQLAYSINGFYGSEKIDSMEYLRRFIDIEYNLPQPSPELYCNYLYDLYGLGVCIKKAQDELDFKNAVNYVFDLKKLNLRQVERIFTLLRIAYCSLRTVSFYDVSVFFFLAYLKVCEPEFYQEIAEYRFTIQQFVDKLENFSVREGQEKSVIDFEPKYLGMMASIICCYFGGLEGKWSYNKERVGAIFSNDGNLTLKFKYFDEDQMRLCISGYYRPGSHNKIEFFTEKLALLEPFRIE